MKPNYKHRFFILRGYSFYCIPNRYNEYDAKYKLFYSHENSHEFIGYADTVAEAKKRARWFLNYYLL